MTTPTSLAFPSLVQQTTDFSSVACGRIVHNDAHHVTAGQQISKSIYIHDESIDQSTEIARDEVTLDTTGASMTLGVLKETASGVKTMQPVVTTTPEHTVITSLSGDAVFNLTLDGSISWDRGSACLYLSANKAFRFRYVESDGVLPSRLVLEGLDEYSSEYRPKIEFTTD